MAKLCKFRAHRRSAAERSVLRPLQRKIASVDPVSRGKYVQEFIDAYQTYDRVISKNDLIRFSTEADVLLISDFHALDSCQYFVSRLLEDLVVAGRDTVLLVEAVFVRDQHIVDEWFSGTISDLELRYRLRFNTDWGYAWEPFLHLLKTARGLRIPIYGVDSPPRSGMRRILQRDHHAADAIAAARRRHSQSLLVTLFGESHLAPGHLPKRVRERMLPRERIRILLQNVDALYFRSAGELRGHVEAVRVAMTLPLSSTQHLWRNGRVTVFVSRVGSIGRGPMLTTPRRFTISSTPCSPFCTSIAPATRKAARDILSIAILNW